LQNLDARFKQDFEFTTLRRKYACWFPAAALDFPLKTGKGLINTIRTSANQRFQMSGYPSNRALS
jgi:hypothetical protein